uniref:(northern house mosquito) hypothetical protein n=1 Tax=Culex pipiens TaxID=7175 RepID=A0A8D8G003_CULPI
MDRLPEGHGELRFQSVLRPNKEYGKVRTLRQGERHVRVLLQPEPGTAPECQPVPFEQLSGDVLQRRKHPRLELPPVQEQPGGDQEAGHLAASLDSGGPLQAVLRCPGGGRDGLQKEAELRQVSAAGARHDDPHCAVRAEPKQDVARPPVPPDWRVEPLRLDGERPLHGVLQEHGPSEMVQI